MKVFLGFALLVAVAFAEPPPPLYNQPQQQQQQPAQGQRYFFARQQQAAASSPAPAPYAPSGWKPEGPAFNLPERQPQVAQVDNSYGPPQEPQQQQEVPNNQYIPPQAKSPARRQPAPSALKFQQFNSGRFEKQTQARAPRPQEQYNAPQQYGAPEFGTTDFPDSSEFDEPTTVVGLADTEPEPLDSRSEFDEDIDATAQNRHQQPAQQERGQYYVALPDGRLQRVRYVSRQDLEAMRYFAKIRAENVEPLRGPIYAYAPLQKLEVAPGTLQVNSVSSSIVSGASNGLTVSAVESKPQKLLGPKVDIKPLAQLQYQHDNQARETPVSSGYAAYTSEYQAPVAVPEERYILAFP